MSTFGEKMQVIERHQAGGPKVDVAAIAGELGLKIYTVAKWSDNVSGMIKKNDQDNYAIYVNGNHGEPRQRFTIAHEIAHFILHEPLIGNGIADDALYRSGLSNAVEAEANQLAADILMPRDKVKEYWDNPDCTLDDMAEAFGVSKQAMAIRLGVPSGTES